MSVVRLVLLVVLAAVAVTLLPQLAEVGDASGRLPVAPGSLSGER
jgi:hypothetical protein